MYNSVDEMGAQMNSQEFTDILASKCALEPGAKVLIACSGGADSVALLLRFSAIRQTYPLSLVCVHVEHGIRGEASLADAGFVRQLCAEENIPFRLCTVNVPMAAQERHVGIEAAARELRYEALRRLLREERAEVIALAHHRRDQAETVLMHLLRGCDTDALAGMSWREQDLIRPFLGTDPEELRADLLALGRQWREDATNADTAYTRNRVRLCVLPEMEKAYPGAEKAICRLAEAAGRDRAYFACQVRALRLEEQVLRFPFGLACPTGSWAGMDDAILSRAMVALISLAGLPVQDRFVIDRLCRMVQQRAEGALNLSGDGRARTWRGLLILVRPVQVREWKVPGIGRFESALGTFSLCPADAGETGDGRLSQCIPAALLDGARFILPENALPFTPFGRPLSRSDTTEFLKKVPLPQEIRARLPVLVSREGEVLWLAGVRPSEQVRYRSGPGIRITVEGGLDIPGKLHGRQE